MCIRDREEGAFITNSIIMNGTVVKAGARIEKSIIAEDSEIGENAELGAFEEAPNKFKPNIYSGGLVTVGEGSVIPANVKIGKNVAIVGKTTAEDYPNGILASGESIIRQ